MNPNPDIEAIRQAISRDELNVRVTIDIVEYPDRVYALQLYMSELEKLDPESEARPLYQWIHDRLDVLEKWHPQFTVKLAIEAEVPEWTE